MLIFKDFVFFTNTDVYRFGCPNYLHLNSIKQCPHRSRKVSDTDYKTKNLRTRSFKIKILAHIFFTAPPANQLWKPTSGAKKMHSTKIHSFIPQRLKDPTSSICFMKKQLCGVSHI